MSYKVKDSRINHNPIETQRKHRYRFLNMKTITKILHDKTNEKRDSKHAAPTNTTI